MGFLRLYLALCVVAAHAGAWVGPWMLDSVQAVQSFYIISGFYMQLILSGKYAGVGQFYESRALRIYVPYFVVLAIVVVVSVVSGVVGGRWLALGTYVAEGWGGNDPGAVVVAAMTNVTVFGQDAIHFLNGTQGEFLRFRFGEVEGVPLWRYLLIPPSWTIAVELAFYAVVPFLVRLGWRALVGVVAGSLVLRVVAYEGFGLDADPWIYRFFPFELALFVAGMLACRAFRARGSGPGLRVPYPVLVAGLFAGLVGLNAMVRGFSGVVGWHYAVFGTYLAAVLALPLVFGATMSNRFDRMVGELSFPVYLNHFLVVQFVEAWGFPGWVPAALRGEFVMVVSVVFAGVLLAGFLIPFERWRHAMVGVPR
jgi:peptidoglycan/LPS O-acetylase OafA/YrhL